MKKKWQNFMVKMVDFRDSTYAVYVRFCSLCTSISAALLTPFTVILRTLTALIFGYNTNWFLYQMSILLQVLDFGIGRSKTLKLSSVKRGGNTRDFL